MPQNETENVTKEDIKIKEEKRKKNFPNNQPLKIIPTGDKAVAFSLFDYAMQKETEIMILGINSESKIKDIFIGSVANEFLGRPTNKALLFIKPTK